MNRWLGRWLMLFLAMQSVEPAMASPAEPLACSVPKTQFASGKRTRYLISAVLRKGVQGLQIRLVHTLESAGNADEATGIFLRRVQQEYAGYSVMSTLTSEVEDVAPACPARGALHASGSFNRYDPRPEAWTLMRRLPSQGRFLNQKNESEKNDES
ncbi:hypothetical protein [Variovorax sp. JS1663]|uniref:hypothetical protein n=1 Tax=Variovorax sp. JS1663 TaxID=1851577 RepID=UPI00117DF828|nr:hypothetical protein [Variovorax sp. JS1663]